MRRGGALGVVGRRLGHDQPEKPGVANLVVRKMEGELPCPQGGCLAEVLDARLDREGFWWTGKKPPENTSGKPGEWQHSWQYWASSVSDFRKTTILSVRSAASRAHLRSHSSLNAGAALTFAPTDRCMSFERTCSGYCCWKGFNSRSLDEAVHLVALLLWTLGRHRAACARTGRLKKRAILVRVCREGGARGRYNAFERFLLTRFPIALVWERRWTRMLLKPSSHTPLPLSTLRDGDRTRRVGGHIGRCGETKGKGATGMAWSQSSLHSRLGVVSAAK